MSSGIQWLQDARLWLVLDTAECAPRGLGEVTAAALAGGVDAVVLRIKGLPAAEVVAEGRPVARACQAAGKPLIVSHCLDAVRELGASGFHTGIHGEPIGQARARLASETAIGYSAHSATEAWAAAQAGADYLFLGPIYDTPTKRAYGLPPGPLLVEAATHVGIPRIAIGGIRPGRVMPLLEAGAQGVAVIGWICGSQDPRAAAAQLKAELS